MGTNNETVDDIVREMRHKWAKYYKEAAHRREIENVRALVKELADALDNRIDCRSECDGCSMPSCTNKANRALVARARIALKGENNALAELAAGKEE